MKNPIWMFVSAIALLMAAASTSSALTSFKKVFDEKYVKSSGDENFQAAYKKHNCNVCHVKGEKRDVVNAYGMELAKLIPGNAKRRLAGAKDVGNDAKDVEDAKILKELEEALKKAEELKSLSGETYGEILRAHKLPLGEAVGSVKPQDAE